METTGYCQSLKAPTDAVVFITVYLTLIEVATLQQPLYSPVVSRADIFQFPVLEESLKGHCFENVPNIQQDVIEYVKDIMAENL
ncbi:hypothetical protein NPIL_245071 [Nephila pilipes]|uniref:Uncharacterized protein n=1 Tax=Nephila pilipes TaxID=299642 RepID=A0A8X6P3R3_NEPPI|nr:hypothetical protein NPIL_245071 [Nephila pilipes]